MAIALTPHLWKKQLDKGQEKLKSTKLIHHLKDKRQGMLIKINPSPIKCRVTLIKSIESLSCEMLGIESMQWALSKQKEVL